MRSETTTKPLRELLQRFNSGAILLPQFQRDYVWKAGKIRNLLDSLLRELPIGGFYLWQPTGKAVDAKPKAFGTGKISEPSAAYLIDGQQRLTSLEAAFGLFTGEDRQGSELRCFLDLSSAEAERKRDTRLFVSYAGRKSIRQRIDKGDPTLIEVKRFFDKMDFQLRETTEKALRALPGWSGKRVSDAMDRYDRAYKMLDQQVPCTTVQNVTDEEAVEIFNRLNKGGSALREGDVRAAELARGPAVKVLKGMRSFVAEDRPRQMGFGFSFAFRALVVFHRQSAQFKSLPADWVTASGPHKRSLADSWEIAERALAKALKFVDERMGWSRRALVPSANAIIVLAYALGKSETAGSGSEAEQKYRRWLILATLRGIFQGSVETTINRFVRAIRDTRKQPATALLEALTKNERRPVQAEELRKPAQLWGPGTQALYAWLVRKRARDWLNEESIDALARSGDIGLAGGDLTIHHIFPRSAAAKYLANPNDANCLANFAVISRESNSKINDEEPETVLERLNSKQKVLAAVQFFGVEAGDRLKIDNYEEFRDWRAQRLAEAFNQEYGIK